MENGWSDVPLSGEETSVPLGLLPLRQDGQGTCIADETGSVRLGALKKARISGVEDVCLTTEATYLAGKGLYALRGDKVEKIAPRDMTVRLCAEADLDGSAFAVSIKGDSWLLEKDRVTPGRAVIPKCFFVAVTVARFRGESFISGGDSLSHLVGDTAEAISLPTKTGTNRAFQSTISLRVTGGKLWAVCPHQLLYTEDGAEWKAVSFR
jgi:hypothetical protein